MKYLFIVGICCFGLAVAGVFAQDDVIDPEVEALFDEIEGEVDKELQRLDEEVKQLKEEGKRLDEEGKRLDEEDLNLSKCLTGQTEFCNN